MAVLMAVNNSLSVGAILSYLVVTAAELCSVAQAQGTANVK
jgi:hypothetical protein